jgi:antitoxin component of RelBE/YafQ-DinJ toxin-antitoxin module
MKPKLKKPAVNLSLDPEIRQEAEILAEQAGETLTKMVERLLLAEIANPGSAPSEVDIAKALRAHRIKEGMKAVKDEIAERADEQAKKKRKT